MRKHSRQTRLIRLRWTALPTFFVTTKPTRAHAARSGSRAATSRTKWAVDARWPTACTRRKSVRRRIRRSLPNEKLGARAVRAGGRLEGETKARSDATDANDLLRVDRDGQARAALTTTVRKNLGAALGRHTSAETVGTEAARVVGLKSSLRLCHDGFS